MQLTSPKTVFSNDELTELEWVLASVCDALEAEQCKPDENEKAGVRRRLFVLACNGVSDPRTLHDHLIRSFTPSKKVHSERAA
jgi:hypothetical protein